MLETAGAFFRTLQEQICSDLERLDGVGRFEEDVWERPGGGGGYTRVLTDGAVFERAGVNWSGVHGMLPIGMDGSATPEPFHATGVSLVLHPRSPMIPTVHANFRMIRRGTQEWFGGGADLTPCFPYLEDAVHFHSILKAACDRHDADWYQRFKTWCDGYFFLPHRNETRGIGGVFFDYLGLASSDLNEEVRQHSPQALEEAVDLDRAFAFVQDIGSHFMDAYLPIAERHRETPHGDAERQFQLLRRGRYVEFNLIHDRGTTFGLRTGGRTESILMSLPPLVRWEYDHVPEEGTRQAELKEFLRPRDWLGIES